MQYRNPLAFHPTPELQRLFDRSLRKAQRCSAGERKKDLAHHHVKRKSGYLRNTVIRSDVEPLPPSDEDAMADAEHEGASGADARARTENAEQPGVSEAEPDPASGTTEDTEAAADGDAVTDDAAERRTSS